MIIMDLISHDISLHCYMVTDVIEIHLLEPGVVFHSITGAPPGGRAEMAKKKKKAEKIVMKTKKLAACSGLGQVLLWRFLWRNLERVTSGVLAGGSAKLKPSALGSGRRVPCPEHEPGHSDCLPGK